MHTVHPHAHLSPLITFQTFNPFRYVADDPFRVRLDMWMFYSCQAASVAAVALAVGVLLVEEAAASSSEGGEGGESIGFSVMVLVAYTFSLLVRSCIYVKRWSDTRRMKNKHRKAMAMRERRASAASGNVRMCPSCKAVNAVTNPHCTKCCEPLEEMATADGSGLSHSGGKKTGRGGGPKTGRGGLRSSGDSFVNIVLSPVDGGSGGGGGGGGGWSQYTDPTSGSQYYHHAETGETAWTLPVGAAISRTVATVQQDSQGASFVFGGGGGEGKGGGGDGIGDRVVMEVELASPIRARLSRAVALQEKRLERASVEFGEGGSSAAKAAVAEAAVAEAAVAKATAAEEASVGGTNKSRMKRKVTRPNVAAAAQVDSGGGGGSGTRSGSGRSGSRLGSKTVSTISFRNSTCTVMDEDVEL